MSEYLSLPQACTALHGMGAPISYQAIWSRVTSGKVPCLNIAGKSFIARADLPAIAATLQAKA